MQTLSPKVSVIISFYNKIELLVHVLDSLEKQTFQEFEVVIADDGSKDEAVAHIKTLCPQYSFPIYHLWHEDEGWRKNRALNRAVLATHADYIIFIDGDCILERHFVAEHYHSRRQGEVITGRRVLLTPKTTDWLLRRRHRLQDRYFSLVCRLLFETLFCSQKTQLEQMIRLPRPLRTLLGIKERKRYILGCNFSLFKSDLLSVNGFDERFQYPGYGEDIDLEFRLSRKGVAAMSRKCQLVQFHCYHRHFDTDYAPNKQLLAENNSLQITFTPYGIQK